VLNSCGVLLVYTIMRLKSVSGCFQSIMVYVAGITKVAGILNPRLCLFVCRGVCAGWRLSIQPQVGSSIYLHLLRPRKHALKVYDACSHRSLSAVQYRIRIVRPADGVLNSTCAGSTSLVNRSAVTLLILVCRLRCNVLRIAVRK
jgi:hypothetical protein